MDIPSRRHRVLVAQDCLDSGYVYPFLSQHGRREVSNAVVVEPFYSRLFAQPGYQVPLVGEGDAVLMAEDELAPFRLGMFGQGTSQSLCEWYPIVLQ